MSRKRNHARQTVFRPAPPRRAIFWFPTLESLAARRIERFRAEHDPLAPTIAPHVALVFPFYAHLTVAQLESHIKRATRGWPVLPITFRSTERVASEFAVLSADLRGEALTELHDRLYRGPLAQFLRTDIEYTPHLTLGRATAVCNIDQLMQEAELCFREPYSATLRELQIVTLLDDGTIELTKSVPLILA